MESKPHERRRIAIGVAMALMAIVFGSDCMNVARHGLLS